MEIHHDHTMFYENRPEWLVLLLEQADQNAISFLKKHSRKYRKLWEEMEELMRAHPKIFQLLEGEGSITLDEKEHAAFRRYQAIKSLLGGLERDQIYWQGHRHCHLYHQYITEHPIHS